MTDGARWMGAVSQMQSGDRLCRHGIGDEDVRGDAHIAAVDHVPVM